MRPRPHPRATIQDQRVLAKLIATGEVELPGLRIKLTEFFRLQFSVASWLFDYMLLSDQRDARNSRAFTLVMSFRQVAHLHTPHLTHLTFAYHRFCRLTVSISVTLLCLSRYVYLTMRPKYHHRFTLFSILARDPDWSQPSLPTWDSDRHDAGHRCGTHQRNE